MCFFQELEHLCMPHLRYISNYFHKLGAICLKVWCFEHLLTLKKDFKTLLIKEKIAPPFSFCPSCCVLFFNYHFIMGHHKKTNIILFDPFTDCLVYWLLIKLTNAWTLITNKAHLDTKSILQLTWPEGPFSWEAYFKTSTDLNLLPQITWILKKLLTAVKYKRTS